MHLHATASTGGLALLSLLTAIPSFISPVTALPQVGRQLDARDVRTGISDSNNEGERHGDIDAPDGSILTTFPVGNGQDVATFWSKDPNNEEAKHAFIMIHGKLRDGDTYWKTMNDILNKAVDDNYPGADDGAIIVAPQFFSTKYNKGQYDDNVLAWDDTNAWQAGDPANHPKDTTHSSFDALDALVEEFLDEDKYPNMKNITVVGHGGGGQLNIRYAMVAKTPTKGSAHIRYIHGDPSSSAYFTRNRVQSVDGVDADDLPSRDDCSYYNKWRYGFDEFNGTDDGLKTAKEYFQQYITRDVVSIVGYDDTDSAGDNLCAALMQGGYKRRNRNLIWWQYVNQLARTDEDLTGFPGTFGDLPDWSDVSDNKIQLRLTVVEDADHDAEAVFAAKEGRASLFDKDVPTGWRPEA